MSQHSQRTQHGPSWASIITGAVLVAGAVAVSTWITTSPALTWREATGAAGWSLLAMLLTGQVVGRVVERKIVEDRVKREAERLDRQVSAAREVRRVNTGTWQGDAVGQVLTVRYDPEDGTFYAEGWLGDHFQLYPERAWHDRATLVQTLAELETTGELEPVDDEGTRGIRARLDLPGWDREPEQPEPVRYDEPDNAGTGRRWEDERDTFGGAEEVRPPMTRERAQETAWLADVTRPASPVGDETQVLRVPHRGGPSAAALTPIQVPVFRTEAERAQWAAEREWPTEVLPLDTRHRPDA